MTEETTAPKETIFEALAKAQGEFETVQKNCYNSGFKSRYADLQSILAACRPALNRHSLFLYQKVESADETIKVETILVHASGETLSSGVLTMSVPTDGKTNSVQRAGSALTYARRYSLSAFLGVAADDDDDGNGVQEPAKEVFVLTDKMVEEGKAIAEKGVEAYKAYYQKLPAPHREELSKSGWHKALYAQAKAADEAGKEAA